MRACRVHAHPVSQTRLHHALVKHAMGSGAAAQVAHANEEYGKLVHCKQCCHGMTAWGYWAVTGFKAPLRFCCVKCELGISVPAR